LPLFFFALALLGKFTGLARGLLAALLARVLTWSAPVAHQSGTVPA
jgi:hypothetical protein